MKKLSELKLTAHDKAWMKIGPKYHKWTFDDVLEDLEEKHGVKIDPESLRAYLKDNSLYPFVAQGKRRRGRKRDVTIREQAEEQLKRDAKAADASGDFDVENEKDGRQQVMRRINLRRGQPEFRKTLLDAYKRRCAVTGYDCADALEAAHIMPYRGKQTHHVQNGLLLRSDIHTLFDLGRIGVDSTGKILISTTLRGTVYESLKDNRLEYPVADSDKPSEKALKKHALRWGLSAF